jgi:hypothetical protein
MLRETRELHFLLKNCEMIKASNLVNFFKAHSNDSSIEKKSHIYNSFISLSSTDKLSKLLGRTS